MHHGRAYRTVVYRMTGTTSDGRVQRLELDAGASTARVHINGAAVYLTETGDVEWDSDVPYEVWVPIERLNEWKAQRP